MIYKIAVWAVLSFIIGRLLNDYFQPVELVYSVVVFAVPLILFGFQNNFRTREHRFEFFGLEIFHYKVDFQQLTFWGIPVAKEQTVGSSFKISNKEGGKKLLLVSRVILRYLPAIFTKRLGK